MSLFKVNPDWDKGRHSGFSTVSRSKPKVKRLSFLWFWPATIFYMEIIMRAFVYTGTFFGMGLIYTLLFSLSIGAILTILCTIGNHKVNRRVTIGLLLVMLFVFGFHYVCRLQFQTFFTLTSFGVEEAENVTEFWKEALVAIAKSIPAIILFSVPTVAFTVFGKKYMPAMKTRTNFKILALIVSVVAHLLCYIIISINSGTNSDAHYYKSAIQANETVKRFGIITTTRMDLTQLIFGAPETTVEHPIDQDILSESSSEPEIIYDDNVMDIDFDALIENESNSTIKDMHKYFSSLTPTKQNEYTGMFKGKNLIYLTLEGFCPEFISPELTPTLYKMSNEGFVFENYYNSLWGGSTASGEYSNVTGNFYNAANCLRKSGSTKQPFVLGNQMKKIGYKTYAYHNNTYTYYTRNLSHPNFGYSYKGIGNGLTGLKSCWPRSDYEMAVQSINVDNWISETPFHVYYMTVSGHCNYTWNGNQMAVRHRDVVRDMDYSENIKAYIACNYEVELMLAELVRQLDEKGILDDTVFVMTADHYPYALEDDELAELYGLPESRIRDNFDLYRNGLIIWSSSMEAPVKVSKPCSSIDILPTVSNLFGLEYDSRLITGKDILSDSEGLVILNCLPSGSWNWITDKGSYKAWKHEFTLNPEFEGQYTEEQLDEYVDYINKVVSAKQVYSLKILDKNYYKYLKLD